MRQFFEALIEHLTLRDMLILPLHLPVGELLYQFIAENMPIPLAPLEVMQNLYPRHAKRPAPEIISIIKLLPQRHDHLLHNFRGLLPVGQHGSHIPIQRLLLLRVKTEKLFVLGIKRGHGGVLI
jgi:hypothetical protein